MVGRIDVDVGCMFADKSSRAAALARRWHAVGLTVLAVNHSLDTRYGRGAIATHARRGGEFEAISAAHLLPLRDTEEYKAAHLVVIDEAQFFDDLLAFCTVAAEADNKRVAVFGLDGTFDRAPFGQVTQLCAVADTFVKHQAMCQFCKDGTPAPFTLALKIMPDTGVLIGGGTEYAAVCRSHYITHSRS